MVITAPRRLTVLLPVVLAAISVIAGLFSLFFSGLFWARYHIDIPFADTLELLPIVQAIVDKGWNGVTFHDWISGHSGAHRIFVARLLMALEYKYFSGRNTLLYLGHWLSIATLVYLYFNISRLSKPKFADVSVFMLGIALVFTCGYTLMVNFIEPINATWTIAAACSALSVYLLVSRGRELTVPRALGACFFVVVAAYCVFSGVIACLVVALLLLQIRTKLSVGLAVCLVVFVALYLQDLKSGKELVSERLANRDVDITLRMHLKSLIKNRERLFQYVVAFLCAPVPSSQFFRSLIFTIPSFLLITYGWVRLARQGFAEADRDVKAERFYLAMATICLGTAISCYIGRGFLDHAADPRYQTIAMLFWLSVGGLLLHIAPDMSDPLKRAGYMSVVLLLPVGLFLGQSGYGINEAVDKSNYANEIEITTRMGSPNFRDPNSPGSNYFKHYNEFEDFLAKNTILKPDSSLASKAAHNISGHCPSIQFITQADSSSGFPNGMLKAVINGKFDWIQRFRRLEIIGADGGQGYLYPTPTGKASVATLLWGDVRWIGYYRGGAGTAPATLVFDSVLGQDLRCSLDPMSR